MVLCDDDEETGREKTQGKIPTGGVSLSLPKTGPHLGFQIILNFSREAKGLESQTLPHRLHFGGTMHYVETLDRIFRGRHC